jgi:hypothetical protein
MRGFEPINIGLPLMEITLLLLRMFKKKEAMYWIITRIPQFINLLNMGRSLEQALKKKKKLTSMS